MSYKISYVSAVLGAMILLTSPVHSADDQHAQHQEQSKKAGQQQSAGSKALHDAMMKGMDQMHSMKMTGKTDADFATMMIHHHEQAIAMARAELEHGSNPDVQKKAREIIAASQKDIADLRKWQK